MPRSNAQTHAYWEGRVKRTWEALRRNSEFRQDCDTFTNLSNEEAEAGKIRFSEKWGVESNNYDASYDELMEYRLSQSAVLENFSSEVTKDLTNIPIMLVGIEARLKGLSGGIDTVVRSLEFEEARQGISMAALRTTPESLWGDLLGEWAPPQKCTFIIDLDANFDAIEERVREYVLCLRHIRTIKGLSPRGSDRTAQAMNELPVDGVPPVAGTRLDFAQDDSVFQVWDLKQNGQQDSAIAEIIWPREFKQKGGRNTKTSEKGSLVQRVADYGRRAQSWIDNLPSEIRHPIVLP